MSDDVHSSHHLHRRALHGKRSFKHGSALAVDSPLYDASEEDNDDTGDDGSVSVVPSPQLSRNATANSPLGPNANPRGAAIGSSAAAGSRDAHRNGSHTRSTTISKVQGASIQPLDNEALYSPNDGDVESSTIAPGSAGSSRPAHPHTHASQLSTSTFAEDDSLHATSRQDSWNSSTSTASSQAGAPSGSPLAATLPMPSTTTPLSVPNPAIHIVTPPDVIYKGDGLSLGSLTKITPHPDTHPLAEGEPKPADVSAATIDPSALTPDSIRAFVKDALEGTGDIPRTYTPNPPPTDRPVRIYADGVYDIFHFGHALQLRQAKLSFPSVHLLVGVCSDELCIEHKSKTVMNHAERCESVRHCRWVDEIVSDAPWVIDQNFLDKHEIDYVAHDEDPYKGSDGSDDVYGFCKSIGRFIPTRRTPGVSTSELLERIVGGYLDGQWDPKLIKMGHPELASRAPSRAASRPESRLEGHKALEAPTLTPPTQS